MDFEFSTGALSVASGNILFLTATQMVVGRDAANLGSPAVHSDDPLQLAGVPLGVPYLLNSAGIVILVTGSAEPASLGVFTSVDVVVFQWANQVSEHLVEHRLLVTAMAFGFWLAALAVHFALNGLAGLGVIELADH
jgi:multiple antibiotic resistance protein